MTTVSCETNVIGSPHFWVYQVTRQAPSVKYTSVVMRDVCGSHPAVAPRFEKGIDQ
ncbi:hypothetical protein Gbro_3723 [Gordonia bronchialis DSM 43247]|uniref:Uncharacterized protein n=1 Tax=Gordonia bronchialis (strain ATCC 25592 / DSM 43247 / BCRC 13721 / JCM 3198 / KCTC 3076 / NBRC 16047 / NCTC 10667) TaxID=526226 RepID=D0L2K4_GORB4|nr:hypothetical protein Gbro_3723 [Gordonia bronchialis DSM 43247]STQ65854.1 Uncharacterised protein [Gordonia bronchialis]